MTTGAVELRRASTYSDIEPLVTLCKFGKLFAVQDWVQAGKPVNPPSVFEGRQRPKYPLMVAIESGFHSLVQVLLQAGASPLNDEWGCPMSKALQMRRLDIIELLVEAGYDASSIDMKDVLACWDPEIMEFFIDRGAEVEKGKPLAYAFCNRIRTALRIFKRYKDRFPSFREQANIALRYHCKEGNMKWISLMLWLGADPYCPGSIDCEGEDDEDEDSEDRGLSALGYAALYNHFDVFGMKQIRLDAQHPVAHEVMRYIDDEKGTAVLQRLLAKGMNPNDQENGGCSAIQSLLTRLDWDFSYLRWGGARPKRDIDTERSREQMKLIHLLAKHGAKWAPKDTGQINSARQSLVKMKADYTVEFVWIMAKYHACSRESLEQLLRTPTIKKVTSGYAGRLRELIATWE